LPGGGVNWRGCLPKAIGSGLAVGFLTGLFGVGGGFLIIPALVLLLGLPMTVAVGTSLLVIAMNSASGFVGYLGTVNLDWTILAGFTGTAVVGALAGTALVAHVPQAALKRAFAILLLVVGGFVLLKNRDQLHAAATRHSTPSLATPGTRAGVATVPTR